MTRHDVSPMSPTQQLLSALGFDGLGVGWLLALATHLGEDHSEWVLEPWLGGVLTNRKVAKSHQVVVVVGYSQLFAIWPRLSKCADCVRQEIDEMKSNMPCIMDLGNPAMRPGRVSRRSNIKRPQNAQGRKECFWVEQNQSDISLSACRRTPSLAFVSGHSGGKQLAKTTRIP